MSNLLSNLLSQAKKSELSHGIHEDCILLEVSNKTRKTKDGNPITKNGYTKFGKLNDKGEVTAEKEISWWDIDHNSEYAGSNLFEQLTQMVNLLDCLVDPEVVEKKFDAMLEDQEIETKADLEEAAKSKSGLKEVITAINEIYVIHKIFLCNLPCTRE